MSLLIELEHYVTRLNVGLVPDSDKEQKARLLQRQLADLRQRGETHCGCGQPINALNGFRCLYCGLYLCVRCAEVHFGITREDYDKTP